MSEFDLGWAWFENTSPLSDSEKPPLDHDLTFAFAKCFGDDVGVKVLAHLKAITHLRSFGPDASDALLRHMEGQRQLVAYITSLIEQGRGHGIAGNHAVTSRGSAIMENTDD